MNAAQLEPLSYESLYSIVGSQAAAIRSRTKLLPAGGTGDKVFPPTYEGGRYAVEERRIDGEIYKVVLLDSVQSQANRLELALKGAYERGEIRFPLIFTDFSAALPHIGRITVLDAPHRIADAIFRESFLDGVPFRQSHAGRALTLARLSNATPLFGVCPTALIFGVWDSTGSMRGFGARFPRALTSEIVGVGVVIGVKTASRLDPLPIKADIEIYQAREGSGAPGGWTLDPGEAVTEGNVPRRWRAAERNLGNVTPNIVRDNAGEAISGGVTIDYALQTTVLSLPALRRLQFPTDNSSASPTERDQVARTLLAALALAAVAYLREEGYDLRSRCLLIPTEPLVFEVVPNDGSEVKERFTLSARAAADIFNKAVEEARRVGLPWPEPGREEIRLTPSDQLVELVRRSEALLRGNA